MPDIVAVDPNQQTNVMQASLPAASIPLPNAPAQTAAPVAVPPAPDPLTAQLPVSTQSPVPAAATTPATPTGPQTVSITADGGKVVTTTIDPNKTYVFYDKKTGQIEVMGVGEAGARAAAARGQAISSANKKNKSDWRIFATDDPNSDMSTWGNPVLYDKHHKSLLGKIGKVVGGIGALGLTIASGGTLAAPLLGVLGSSLLGGKGSKTPAAGTPTGQLPLNPTFKAALPTPGPLFSAGTPRTGTDLSSQLSGAVASSGTPGNPTLEQWANYGLRPELSFFNNVPKQGYAEGGPVGDGRSDDLTVRLSKGEYVVDAETVALLGNGSPEAGAQKLDEFRVNLRKQKGAALSRGEFTPEARMPEQYMGAR